MYKHMRIVTVLGGLGMLGLVTAGCASQSGSPRALTGEQQQVAESSREIARWTDDKGRFHPEWRVGINRPPGYPKQTPQ